MNVRKSMLRDCLGCLGIILLWLAVSWIASHLTLY